MGLRLFLVLVGFSVISGGCPGQVQPVREMTNLLDLLAAGGVEWTQAATHDAGAPSTDLWKFEDDQLKVMGSRNGWLLGPNRVRNYHLVMEFRWDVRTWGEREGKARQSGLLLQAGDFAGDRPIEGIEIEIQEGRLGDLVFSPRTHGEVEGEKMADGLLRWKKGASTYAITDGRLAWEKRHVDWADKAGVRHPDDPDSPPREWNRLEVIADGASLRVLVNGRVVNEARLNQPAEGRIGLESAGAELTIRRLELWPIGQFLETWNPIVASGGVDVPVRDGQNEALSPEESLRRIELDGDYEVQLVACEPLVRDPVEVTWDAVGRMFVADMIDYPLGPPAGEAFLSRVQQLVDDDGDGRMDRAITFADSMDHVQGLLPYDGGLIATTRTEILFLKDTDDDGKADVRRPLIKGLNPRHSQLQVSAPRWGPDGCVYFNNGLSAAEIYPVEGGGEAVELPRSNFKWNPSTGAITPVSGYGQYGGAFDDWGHHFSCSNRNPLMFAVMPHAAVVRNPLAAISKGHEDIAPFGADTRVYPLQITHTTSDAHAGTNTACCGLGVYRGDLMPELRNNVFVPDPTGQLVTRYKIEPNGSSLQATRVGDRTEFFRSSDEWSRPVNFTTGPDGAIYVCDIYRRWIDHARFFPEEFVKTNDMRQGENEGRIWRVVPKGAKQLVAKVPGRHHAVPEAGWGERPEEHSARATFLGAQSITDPAELAAILTDHPDDPWMAKMVASSASSQMGRVLGQLGNSFFATFSENRASTIRLFTAGALRGAEASDVDAVLALLERQPGELLWWKPALLQGLAKLPEGHEGAAREIAALQSVVDTIIADEGADIEQRVAVLPLLAQRKWEAVEATVRELLTKSQPEQLSTAALALLKRFPATTTSPLLYEFLGGTNPILRREAVSALASNSKTALELFQRMEKGEFSPALVDAETRWRHLRNKEELGDVARRLFGESNRDRAKVIADYMDCATQTGDATKGKEVFAMVCVACHRLGDQGADVGPSLADVRVKPPEALLADILDPNRMFEARWSAYQVETKGGRTLSGLLESETTSTVTLKLMGGATESIERGQIRSFRSLDRTLMPEGLEAAVTPEQMTDLLAFLLGR